MIKDLTKITQEDIEESAKEAAETPIIALQDNAEVYADALCALHMKVDNLRNQTIVKRV